MEKLDRGASTWVHPYHTMNIIWLWIGDQISMPLIYTFLKKKNNLEKKGILIKLIDERSKYQSKLLGFLLETLLLGLWSAHHLETRCQSNLDEVSIGNLTLCNLTFAPECFVCLFVCYFFWLLYFQVWLYIYIKDELGSSYT